MFYPILKTRKKNLKYFPALDIVKIDWATQRRLPRQPGTKIKPKQTLLSGVGKMTLVSSFAI